MELIETPQMICSCKFYRRLACERQKYDKIKISISRVSGVMENHDSIFVSNRTYKGAKNTRNETMLPIVGKKTENISEGSIQK